MLFLLHYCARILAVQRRLSPRTKATFYLYLPPPWSCCCLINESYAENHFEILSVPSVLWTQNLKHVWKSHLTFVRSSVNVCTMHKVDRLIENAVWFLLLPPWGGMRTETTWHLNIFPSFPHLASGAWEPKDFHWAPNILLIQTALLWELGLRAFGIQPASILMLWKVNVEYLFNTNDPCSRLSSSAVVSIVLHRFYRLEPSVMLNVRRL